MLHFCHIEDVNDILVTELDHQSVMVCIEDIQARDTRTYAVFVGNDV